MGLARSAFMSIAFCFSLAACNTTDALTPPEDIGDAGSSPVTQRDTERMAAVSRQQTYGSSQRGYEARYQQQTYQSSNYGGGGTLDDQASALRNGGSNPYASRPLDSDRQETAAISRDTSQPSESDEQREADSRLADDPQPQQAQEEQQQAALPPSTGGNSVRFLPIIGAPVDAVTPLSRQLGAEARSHGLTIKSSSDASASYILKGYLSAFEDGPAISVSYVWDVLDNNGARLHRIQGTESAPLKRGDPWAAVPPSVMQKIATKTMQEFDSWRDTRGG